MAVPTVGSVTPAVIFTGGQLVTVTGTNFQVAYPPPESNGPLPAPLPTVVVTVGGKAARSVVVHSATRLTAVIPALDAGTYALAVQNMSALGAAIPGETATLAAAVTARRVDLAVETDFTRVERALMKELKRQVIDNVLKTAAVDYDGTPGGVFDVPDIATLPALAIQGPQVMDNRPYDTDVSLVTVDGAGNYTRRRTFKTVNLTYRFVAMDTHQVRNMNLLTLMLQFLQNNPYIELRRDESDASKGHVKYELAQVGEFTTFTGSSESNIRGFSGSLVIRGFGVEDVAGFVDQTVAERGRAVDNVIVESQSLLPPD